MTWEAIKKNQHGKFSKLPLENREGLTTLQILHSGKDTCRRLPPVTEITILHRQENKIQHRVHCQYTEYRLWTLKTSFI